MLINNNPYRTIWFDKASESVKIIDQTKLPFNLEIVSLKTLDDVILAINEMQVRGAPLNWRNGSIWNLFSLQRA